MKTMYNFLVVPLSCAGGCGCGEIKWWSGESGGWSGRSGGVKKMVGGHIMWYLLGLIGVTGCALSARDMAAQARGR